MDSTTRLQYLVSGNDQSGRVNLGCPSAEAALKKARAFVEQGYVDVRICTPRGQILLSDEFDRLEG
jgi:hypothetical protein